MKGNLKYQFIDETSAKSFWSSHKDQMIENAKGLVLTDEKLSIQGTELHYRAVVEGKEQTGSIDLAEVWIPGAIGWQHPIPLLLHKDYVKAIVDVVDKYANNAKHTISFAKTGVISQFNIASQFVEYFCLNGHIHLSHITKKHIEGLKSVLKRGGIPSMLNIPQRLESFIDKLIEEDNLEPYLRRDDRSKNAKVKGIQIPKLAKAIGCVSLANQVPKSIYRKIYHHLQEKGVTVRQEFGQKGIETGGQPSQKSFGNWFSIWNQFAKLDTADQLQIVPFPEPYKLSKDLGKQAGRTGNLDVEDVVNLLGSSHQWLYEISSILISLVKQVCREKDKLLSDGVSEDYIQRTLLPEFVGKSSKARELEKMLSIEIHKTSLDSSRSNPNAYSLTEIITMLVSSCYVALQTYNCRRQAEIQDPVIGVQEDLFICKSKKLNWYQACLYNEKNNERRWYTLNNSSTKAIQILSKLKKAWNGTHAEGLFVVPNFTISQNGHFNHYKFNFNKGKDSRISGNMFLKLALGTSDIPTGSQTFRCIYAIIYHYQFKNADLLALCHQMGHVDPDNTTVYVTEPAARDQHEQLHHKVKLTKNEKTESTIAIQEENKALEKVIEEVGIEATANDILTLLMGTEEMAGKYTAYLKRVYRVLQKSVSFNKITNENYGSDFDDLSPEDKSEVMAKMLDEKGHKHRPKPHATCHRRKGEAKKHAEPCEPIKCAGCPYQEVKQAQLNIMIDDLIELKTIQSDISKLPIERFRANEDIANLSKLIEVHERSMERSKTLFIKGVSNGK